MLLISGIQFLMTPPTLSYAQSLRVIGQALEALSIDTFELEKRGEEYIVRVERSESAGKLSWEESFLKSIAEKIWGSGDSAKEIANPVRFAGSDVDRLEAEGRSKRGKPNAMPDTNKLSLSLRVLGDYLDRKQARDFAVSWSTHLVTVSYDHKQESFTLENLYDRGVNMYLRRSNRRPAR